MANQDASVLVRQMTGPPTSLSLPASSTVAHLKKLLQRKTSVAVDSQRVRPSLPASPRLLAFTQQERWVPRVRMN
jgi:hypothetical protein